MFLENQDHIWRFNYSVFVDENMENYKIVHDWITGLGFPETAQQFKDLTTDRDGVREMNEQFADGTLRILNSNFNEIAKVKFLDMFPVSLSSLILMQHQLM